MEFVIGTVLGAAVALLAARLAPVQEERKEKLPEKQQEEAEHSIARQWENLLSYTGEKQHEA